MPLSTSIRGTNTEFGRRNRPKAPPARAQTEGEAANAVAALLARVRAIPLEMVSFTVVALAIVAVVLHLILPTGPTAGHVGPAKAAAVAHARPAAVSTLATSESPSASEIDQMTTYAVILGRAMGCRLDTDRAAEVVGRWMDMHFPPGSPDRDVYFPIFLGGTKYHADQQRMGLAPDDCESVQRTLASMGW
jgi:hypothetical protein